MLIRNYISKILSNAQRYPVIAMTANDLMRKARESGIDLKAYGQEFINKLLDFIDNVDTVFGDDYVSVATEIKNFEKYNPEICEDMVNKKLIDLKIFNPSSQFATSDFKEYFYNPFLSGFTNYLFNRNPLEFPKTKKEALKLIDEYEQSLDPDELTDYNIYKYDFIDNWVGYAEDKKTQQAIDNIKENLNVKRIKKLLSNASIYKGGKAGETIKNNIQLLLDSSDDALRDAIIKALNKKHNLIREKWYGVDLERRFGRDFSDGNLLVGYISFNSMKLPNVMLPLCSEFFERDLEFLHYNRGKWYDLSVTKNSIVVDDGLYYLSVRVVNVLRNLKA